MTRHIHIPAPAPGESATAAVVSVLDALRAEELTDTDVLITLDPATYHFDRTAATRTAFTASGIPDAEKYIAVCLDGLTHITLDGHGAELIFDDRMTPLSLRDCRDITLRDFTIDFSFSRYCQGTVTASDESGFTLAIDPDCFSVDVDTTGHLHFRAGSEDFSTEFTEVLLANEVFGRAPWDYIFVGDTNQPREGLATGLLETDAARLDRDHIRFTYRSGTRALVFPVGDIILFNYEPRANVNIFLDRAERITVSDVRMYRGGGMGLVAHSSQDIELDRLTISVRPGRPECRSTTADGLYFVQCTGLVHIHDSVISRTLDDALNIHGIYTRVESVASPDEAVAAICFDPHKEIALYAPGDTLSISDGQTRRKVATATVTAVTPIDDRRVALTLEPPIPLAPGDYIENVSRSATFLFERNRVDHCPHLRISGPAKKVLRDNHFEAIQAIYVSDLMEFWYESGCVRDMTISGNRFVDCPRIGGGHPIYVTCSRGDAGVRHSGILIENNRFTGTCGHAACMEYADDVTLRGNTVTLPDGTPAPEPYLIHPTATVRVD